MIVLGWLGAAALAVAVGFLIRALLVRFPIEERTAVGDWRAPAPAQRIDTPERGFDRSIHRIEMARSDPVEWTRLLAHLDDLADVLDPIDTTGPRPVLAHRRGRKVWEQLDAHGVPTHFNSHYLGRRLASIETRLAGPESRSTK